MAYRLPNAWIDNLYDNPITYTRPSQWPIVTPTSREIKYLVSDQWPSYQVRLTQLGTASCVIDWGDGTTQSILNGVTASKTYTVGGGATTSYGYTTYTMRIYGDGTPNTQMDFCKIVGATQGGYDTNNTAPCSVLEAVFGDDTITYLTDIFLNSWVNTSGNDYKSLEYVRCPATMSGLTMSGAFNGCFSLKKLDLPRSWPNLITASSTFRFCGQLQEIVMPEDAINITSLSTFVRFTPGPSSLKRIYLPRTLDACTSISQFLVGCDNLEYVSLPSLANCTNFDNMFQDCTRLKFVNIPTCNVNTNFSAAFQSCSRLTRVNMPKSNIKRQINLASTFLNCASLEYIDLSDGLNWIPISLASSFSGCSSIKQINLPNEVTTATMSNTFVNCSSLVKVNGLTIATTSNVDMTNLFSGCSKLAELPIAITASNFTATGMSGLLSGCTRLTGELIFTGNIGLGQIASPSVASAFSNCFGIEKIVFPNIDGGSANRRITANGGVDSTFFQCFSLKEIRGFTAANGQTHSIGWSNTFNSCFNLTQINDNLPGEYTHPGLAGNQMSGTFQYCYGLKKITIATASGNNHNLTSAFAGCINLEEVVLPRLNLSPTITGSVANAFAIQALPFTGGSRFHANGIKTVNIDNFAPSTSTFYYDFSSAFQSGCTRLEGLTFSFRISRFQCQGLNATNRGAMRFLKLNNTDTGQYAGASPQINIAFQSFDRTALVNLFTDLPSVGTTPARTIRITGNPGVSDLTAGDRAIATGKNWTINSTT